MVLLMCRAHLVLTDSGGIQEEAPALGLPVLVLRDRRRSGRRRSCRHRDAGGHGRRRRVYRLTRRLLEDEALYERMARAVNPYGDGKAAGRIREAVLYAFGMAEEPPVPFGGTTATPA